MHHKCLMFCNLLCIHMPALVQQSWCEAQKAHQNCPPKLHVSQHAGRCNVTQTGLTDRMIQWRHLILGTRAAALLGPWPKERQSHGLESCFSPFIICSGLFVICGKGRVL